MCQHLTTSPHGRGRTTGPHTTPSIVLLALLLGAVAGCVMSPSAYDSLAREVSARNAERHEAALARLAADGYVVEEDAVRVATLHDTAPCRAGAEASEATPSETGEPPTAVISVVTPERPNAAAARRDPRVARECVHVLRADGARRTDV